MTLNLSVEELAARVGISTKTLSNFERSYVDFFRVTRRLTRDQRELKKAVQRCAFNILMNNRDDHVKNLSFLLDDDGNWRLAPPYDLTYCPGYKGEHFMDVAGEAATPARNDVIKAAKAAGLPVAVAELAIDELLGCARPELLLALAKKLSLRTATVKKVHRTMQVNFARLAK